MLQPYQLKKPIKQKYTKIAPTVPPHAQWPMFPKDPLKKKFFYPVFNKIQDSSLIL